MPDAIHPIDLIIKKRDGQELTPAEIQAFVNAVVKSHSLDRTQAPSALEFISDAQIGSFLMAVFQRGLTLQELAALTQAMRFSGETLKVLPGVFTIDKHSTGGVGDKTSLLIAPVLAAAAVDIPIAVPMISGRALGHTGGTLDKLESIPGFQTQLPLGRMMQVLHECHAVMVGQTPELVPADRILYALRDHTGTVESPELITASIMSKKLAENLQGLVLDVKTGSGAFMPTYAAAKHLAELLVSTGEAAGTRTVALLTTMDQPLGRFAGNWLEVRECVDILQGRMHPLSADLLELSLVLSGHMLHLAHHPQARTPAGGYELAHKLITSGKAYSAWLQIVQAQGGDVTVFCDIAAQHRPRFSRSLHAPCTGYLASMDCKQVGWAVQRLGAGRVRPGDAIDRNAGLEVHAKLGQQVREGEPLFTIFAEARERMDQPARMLLDAVHIIPEPPLLQALVREVVTLQSDEASYT